MFVCPLVRFRVRSVQKTKAEMETVTICVSLPLLFFSFSQNSKRIARIFPFRYLWCVDQSHHVHKSSIEIIQIDSKHGVKDFLFLLYDKLYT